MPGLCSLDAAVDIRDLHFLLEHMMSAQGQEFVCIGHLGDQRDGGVAVDGGEEGLGLLPEAKQSCVGYSVLIVYVKLHVILRDVQQDMQQAAADPGVSHILGL